MSRIVRAAGEGNEEEVKTLLEGGADTEAKDAQGNTALIKCGENGHEGTARVLLKHGADIEAKEKDGFTALISAGENGHEGTARVLLEHGADTEANSANGATALMSAAGYAHESTARVLLEHGANIDAQKPTNGCTALWLAAHCGHLPLVELLLKHNASVDLPSGPWGKGLVADGGPWFPGQEELHDTTPLHQAVESSHAHALAIAQALLVAGADPSRKCNDVAPLQLACAKGRLNVPMAQLLIRGGCETDVFPPCTDPEVLEHKMFTVASTQQHIWVRPESIKLAMYSIGRQGEAEQLRATPSQHSHPTWHLPSPPPHSLSTHLHHHSTPHRPPPRAQRTWPRTSRPTQRSCPPPSPSWATLRSGAPSSPSTAATSCRFRRGSRCSTGRATSMHRWSCTRCVCALSPVCTHSSALSHARALLLSCAFWTVHGFLSGL
jgi:ankyrin repeat protein